MEELNFDNPKMVKDLDAIVESILESKKKTYLRDSFFPKIINKLELKVGAEIGVDTASFTEHLLGSQLNKLYCIDLWSDDFGSDYHKDPRSVKGAIEYDPIGENRFKEAQDRIKEHKDRTVFIRATSAEAATKVKNGSIDFCYIDGDHSFEGVYVDLKSWVPKVRVGGIVSGHDYKDGPNSGMRDYFGGQLPFKVKSIVDDYCLRYGYPLRVIGGVIKSWFFIKVRECGDPVNAHLIQPPEQTIEN